MVEQVTTDPPLAMQITTGGSRPWRLLLGLMRPLARVVRKAVAETSTLTCGVAWRLHAGHGGEPEATPHRVDILDSVLVRALHARDGYP